jgi:hypothetical protein
LLVCVGRHDFLRCADDEPAVGGMR